MSESIKALLAQKWKDSGLFDALSSKASEKKKNNKTTDDDDEAKRNEESLSNVSTTNGDDTLSDDKTITHSNNNNDDNTIMTPEKRRRDTTEPKTQQPWKKQKKIDEYTENLNVAKRIVDIKYESSENYLRGLRFSPDGTQIATNARDNVIRIYDEEFKERLRIKEPESIYNFQFYPFQQK